MKLPQYDNRPGPGQPLYGDSTKNHELESIKFTILGFGLTTGTLLAFGVAAVLLLLTVLN